MSRTVFCPPPPQATFCGLPHFVTSTQLLKPKIRTHCHSSYLIYLQVLLFLPPEFIWNFSSLHVCCPHPSSSMIIFCLDSYLLLALFYLDATCDQNYPAIVSYFCTKPSCYNVSYFSISEMFRLVIEVFVWVNSKVEMKRDLLLTLPFLMAGAAPSLSAPVFSSFSHSSGTQWGWTVILTGWDGVSHGLMT